MLQMQPQKDLKKKSLTSQGEAFWPKLRTEERLGLRVQTSAVHQG